MNQDVVHNSNPGSVNAVTGLCGGHIIDVLFGVRDGDHLFAAVFVGSVLLVILIVLLVALGGATEPSEADDGREVAELNKPFKGVAGGVMNALAAAVCTTDNDSARWCVSCSISCASRTTDGTCVPTFTSTRSIRAACPKF